MSRDYFNNFRRVPFCFYFGWEEFYPAENIFSVNFGYNRGDLYETRLPQTYLENSLYAGNTLRAGRDGLFQIMTSFTNKIISQVYGNSEDSYKFQLMYMPLDSGVYHDDGWTAVIGSLLPVIFLTISRLANQTISATNDIKHEGQISNAMVRSGYRKNVEFYRETILSLVYFFILAPFICLIANGLILRNGMTFSWLFCIALIFHLNAITQENIFKFIFSAKWASRTQQFLTIVSIALHI